MPSVMWQYVTIKLFMCSPIGLRWLLWRSWSCSKTFERLCCVPLQVSVVCLLRSPKAGWLWRLRMLVWLVAFCIDVCSCYSPCTKVISISASTTSTLAWTCFGGWGLLKKHANRINKIMCSPMVWVSVYNITDWGKEVKDIICPMYQKHVWAMLRF